MQLERNALVWGIVGNLGGGKTLSAVEIAVKAMQSEYFIVTNIDLHIDRISLYVGFDVSGLYRRCNLEVDNPFDWPMGDPRGSGGKRRVLVILDEVAEWFDQYAGTSPSVRNFLSWLRHSSKRSQDVFLVCQRREYLAKSLRLLIARWIWVDDLAVYRLPYLRMRVPFCSGLVVRSFFDRQGASVQPWETSAKRTWGRFYETSQMLAGSLGETYKIPPKQVVKHRPNPVKEFVRWYPLLWTLQRLF